VNVECLGQFSVAGVGGGAPVGRTWKSSNARTAALNNVAR
jgi:hypothetical protein